MGTPSGPKYILYSHMKPVGLEGLLENLLSPGSRRLWGGGGGGGGPLKGHIGIV